MSQHHTSDSDEMQQNDAGKTAEQKIITFSCLLDRKKELCTSRALELAGFAFTVVASTALSVN